MRTALGSLGIVALLALCSGSTPAAGQEPSFAFEDQALDHPDLLQWRTRLLEALARHDTTALLAAIHPGILNSFGGDGGIQEFRDQWQLGRDPDRSAIWSQLTSILRGGGRFVDGGLFAAPSYASGPVTPPLAPEWDSFETLMVVGHNVRVRDGPSDTAQVIAVLSLAVVGRDRGRRDHTDDAGRAWTPVHLIRADRPGWIARDFLRSPIDYRAGIERSDTTWLIRSLVAGD